MKRLLLLALFCVLGVVQLHAQNSRHDNPLMADPTIFYHNGIYYLYGTGPGAHGFKVFTSTDKVHWEDKGMVLKPGESYGEKNFWAPQIFQYKGKFYMAYTASEHIAIAEADSPLGPFTQKVLRPVDSSQRMIDPFILIDGGKIYMYHVRLENANRIFVGELTEDLSTLKHETLKECIYPEANTWEDVENKKWKVTEGPTVIKHKGVYYLLYSGNGFRSPDYAVGYATATNPVGPWKKYEGNPIISRKDIGLNGPGHGDVLIDKDGKMYYVLHVHYSDTSIGPRKTAIVDIRFKKVPKGPDVIEADFSTFRLLKK